MGEVSLKSMQIGNTVFKELWPNELARGMPFLTVGGEDAVSEERCPLCVELLSFACGVTCQWVAKSISPE